MDTNQSPQVPQAAKEKKFNGLLFLEVGLAEIFSVIFILTLIFGTLNYFGFLPISESFPFLSFLPTKQKIITNKTMKTGAPKLPTGVAAIVNGAEIAKNDLDKNVAISKNYYAKVNLKQLKGSESAQFAKNLLETILNNMIKEKLLTQYLASKGITITDDEVQAYIQKEFVDPIYKGNWQSYDNFLRSIGVNPESAFENSRRDYLIKKVVEVEKIDPSTFDQWYSQLLKKSDIQKIENPK